MTPTLTNDYKRTLAVIGRFNTDPNTDMLVFDSTDSGAANLSAADVWEKLAPELGQTVGGDLSCAGYAYTNMSLSRPVAGKRDTARPVPLDSMLLEQASSSDKSKADIGGELFVALLRDLDVVARFAGHRFPKALLEVARRYLNVDARRLESGNMIGEAQINRLVADPLFADAIVKVLTAYEADVSLAERELRRALSKGLLDENESPLKASDPVQRAEMVDAIVGSIRKLRFEVLGSGSEPDDTSWKAIMGIEPQVERTRQAMRWVQDMSAGGGFGFDIGEIEGVSVGGTLLDYYDAYIRHAANVHRFVRSPILHSYVFLWLMSKYGDIHEGSGEDCAIMAYRMGIEGAGMDRVRGESMEKILERRKQLFDGSRASYEEIESELEPEEKEFIRGLGEYRSLLIEAIFSQVFRDPRRFTREELQEMLETLFAKAVDVTSGKLGDILDDSIDFGAGFRSLYQGLLGVLESEGTEKEKTERIAKLAEAEDEERRKDVLLNVVANLPKESESKESFKEEALKAFTHQMGRRVDSKFVGECRESRNELESSTQKNKDLYYLASVLGGRTGEVQGRSAEGVLAPMSVDADRGERPGASAKIRKKVELNATSVAQGGASVALPLSDGLRAAVGDVPGRVEIDVRVRSSTADGDKGDNGTGAGKPVGRVKVTANEQRIDIDERIVYELADHEDAPTLEWVLKSEPATESRASEEEEGAANAEEEVAISDENMEEALGEVGRILADGKKRYARARRMGERVAELSSYAELREGLRKISARIGSIDLDEVVRAAVERQLCTLSFGEIVAAAPDSQSFLGKQDISQTLALVIEVVKELGNRRNANLAKAERDDLSDEALGPREEGGPPPRLNLSRFFKVPDDEAEGVEVLENAMDYHSNLCESVSSVVQQLQDLNDLRAIADGMPSGSRLIVINRTLDEYANAVYQAAPKWHFSLNCHPSVVYFPNCADIHRIADTGSTPQRSGMSAWELLKATFVSHRFMRIGPTEDGQEETLVPSCPVIVTANQSEDVLSACPFPSARLDSLGTLGFRRRPGGGATASGPMDGSSGVEPGEFNTRGGLLVDRSRYLASMPAAMTLAVYANDERLLGSLSNDIAHEGFIREFLAVSGVSFRRKERVLSLLRRLWVYTDRGDGCLSAFVLARLATLVLQWLEENQHFLDGEESKRMPFIHHVFEDSQLGAATATGDPAVRSTQQEFLEAAFWPAMPFAGVVFYNEGRCRPANDISKAEANGRVFGVGCDSTLMCVFTDVGGTARREIELSKGSREALDFLFSK